MRNSVMFKPLKKPSKNRTILMGDEKSGKIEQLRDMCMKNKVFDGCAKKNWQKLTIFGHFKINFANNFRIRSEIPYRTGILKGYITPKILKRYI